LRPGDKLPRKDDRVDFTVLDVSDYEPPRAPSKTWTELIKKVWEVDPLTCPQCGSEMLKKAPQQPSGIICAAGVQFIPFMPQDGPQYHLISCSPIPIVIHDFHVIGIGKNGV